MSVASNSIKLNDRVSSLMRKEKYQDAIELLEKEISNVEEDWRLFWNFGWCYFQLEQLNNAQQKLSKALELSPEEPICKWALGTVYREKEEFEKAEILFLEALQIKEGYMVRKSLALTLMQQGKFEEAEKIHLEAINLKPKDYERVETYGDFLSDVGREDEAQQMYAKANNLKGNS